VRDSATAAPAALTPTMVIVFVAGFTMLQPLATDFYQPTLPAIAAAFGSPVAEVQLTLSAFVLAFGLWQLIAGPIADRYGRFFEKDPARANVAELAFGVNDKAEVTGVVLEDEKAGFHWAFGRSDHLGGVVGVEEFRSPDTVIHQDIVYAKGNPIQVERAELVHADGRRVGVIERGRYLI